MDQFLNLSFVLPLHLIFTAMLTGLIWVIQLVHYPSFHFVNIVIYKEFQKFHKLRISIVVMPLMIMELLTSVLLLVLNQQYLFFVNFILILFVWLSTFMLSVPAHSKLERGYNHAAVNQLVNTNWVRTVLWTVRLSLISYAYYSLNMFI